MINFFDSKQDPFHTNAYNFDIHLNTTIIVHTLCLFLQTLKGNNTIQLLVDFCLRDLQQFMCVYKTRGYIFMILSYTLPIYSILSE